MTHIPQPQVSSVAKKLLTGITGLALVLFLVVHLIGNFTLYAGPEVFNAYANFLHHFMHGGFIWFARIGLLTFFVVHIWAGVQVQLSKLKARPTRYVVDGNAGGPSKKSKHSLNMAISGGILLLFVIVHLNHFTIGVEKGVFTMPDGSQIPNAYKMVVASFQSSFLIVLFYMACMAVLCSHLMHGIWSAFQSLGATRPSTIPLLHTAGVAIAIALAMGFFLLPLAIFLMREKFVADAAAAVIQHARLITLPWTQV
jgi:succinate dehydrogenase / fumarate reductase cytochrome b subunit